jgi:hypothetical protein
MSLVSPHLCLGGGGEDTLAGRRGGSIFWKTRDKGLHSYSNNLSTLDMLHVLYLHIYKMLHRERRKAKKVASMCC